VSRTGAIRCAAAYFPGDSVLAGEPVLRDYLADLAEPYGVALREDLLAAGVGHSYGEMGEELLRSLVAEDDPLDLLILPFDIPDVRPGRSTALYLSSVCPGRPEAFAISDQGTAAVFTAIRLAGTYLAAGECRSALVLILEQSALHYEPLLADGEPAPALPEQHAGVALRFDGAVPVVRQYAYVDADEAVRRVVEFDWSSGELSVFVLGEGLAAADAAVSGEVVRPKGQPLTGVWAAYAEHAERWSAERRRIVVADYDVGMRTLSLCVFEAEYGDGGAG
jgi:4-hydroxymandelate oxidase